jgi:NDP-sugar pyrophosphorylase family protein
LKAFILAAGYGKRLAPITDTLPKALVPIQGMPMLEIIINRLRSFGIDEVVINVHHFAEKIMAYCESRNNFGISVQFSHETDYPLDTGGAIKKASHLLQGEEPILVHNVDILTDIDFSRLYNLYNEEEPDVVLAVQDRKTERYLLLDENNFLVGWINVKTNDVKLSMLTDSKIESYAFSGIHLLSPKAIYQISTYEEEVFSITNYYLEKVEELSILGYPHNHTFFMDLGKLENLKFAEYLNLERFYNTGK